MAELALSVKETALALGVSKEIVYELVQQKRIPHIRVGRRVIIPRPALEEWLAGAAERGGDEAALLPSAAPGWGRHASRSRAMRGRGC